MLLFLFDDAKVRRYFDMTKYFNKNFMFYVKL